MCVFSRPGGSVTRETLMCGPLIFESVTQCLSLNIGASSNYTGVVMSAFSFAGLFAAPLFGKWTDYLGKLFYRILSREEDRILPVHTKGSVSEH